MEETYENYIARMKEIIEIAIKLNWCSPNNNGYPFMQLSEVEKCMTAMISDAQLNLMRKWYNQELKSKNEVKC